MLTTDVHAPVDFVLIEFPEDRLTGGAAEALLDLVDRGIVAIYDVLVVGRDRDGNGYSLDLAEAADRVAGFAGLGWARSGLLGEDDVRTAAEAMEPGRLAVLIVYENTWAAPFVAAATESGGQFVASARIPADDLVGVLDALEATGPTGSPQPFTTSTSGA
jgi:hypothetical protein